MIFCTWIGFFALALLPSGVGPAATFSGLCGAWAYCPLPSQRRLYLKFEPAGWYFCSGVRSLCWGPKSLKVCGLPPLAVAGHRISACGSWALRSMTRDCTSCRWLSWR